MIAPFEGCAAGGARIEWCSAHQQIEPILESAAFVYLDEERAIVSS